MDDTIKTWLYDILRSIEEIESYFDSEEKDHTLFISDLKTRRAIERDLEIIGEALNRIINKDDSIKISHARKIVDTRNRIIHGYDTVSDEIMWGIVVKHLPVLRDEVQKLLNE